MPYKIGLPAEHHLALPNESEEVPSLPWADFHHAARTNLSRYFARRRFHPCNTELKRLSESDLFWCYCFRCYNHLTIQGQSTEGQMHSLDSSQCEGTRGAPDSVKPSGAGEMLVVEPQPAMSTANPGQPSPPASAASAQRQFHRAVCFRDRGIILGMWLYTVGANGISHCARFGMFCWREWWERRNVPFLRAGSVVTFDPPCKPCTGTRFQQRRLTAMATPGECRGPGNHSQQQWE